LAPHTEQMIVSDAIGRPLSPQVGPKRNPLRKNPRVASTGAVESVAIDA